MFKLVSWSILVGILAMSSQPVPSEKDGIEPEPKRPKSNELLATRPAVVLSQFEEITLRTVAFPTAVQQLRRKYFSPKPHYQPPQKEIAFKEATATVPKQEFEEPKEIVAADTVMVEKIQAFLSAPPLPEQSLAQTSPPAAFIKAPMTSIEAVEQPVVATKMAEPEIRPLPEPALLPIDQEAKANPAISTSAPSTPQPNPIARLQPLAEITPQPVEPITWEAPLATKSKPLLTKTDSAKVVSPLPTPAVATISTSPKPNLPIEQPTEATAPNNPKASEPAAMISPSEGEQMEVQVSAEVIEPRTEPISQDHPLVIENGHTGEVIQPESKLAKPSFKEPKVMAVAPVDIKSESGSSLQTPLSKPNLEIARVERVSPSKEVAPEPVLVPSTLSVVNTEAKVAAKPLQIDNMPIPVNETPKSLVANPFSSSKPLPAITFEPKVPTHSKVSQPVKVERSPRPMVMPSPAPQPQAVSQPFIPFVSPPFLRSPVLAEEFKSYEILAQATEGQFYLSLDRPVSQTLNMVVKQNVKDKADVVFVIDHTLSMTNEFTQLKRDLKSIIALLSTKEDVFMGISTYSDVNGAGEFGYRNHGLTQDYMALSRFLDETELVGSVEDIYGAVYASAESFQWREDARHLIIVLGDEPPAEKPISNFTSAEIIEKCNAEGIRANLYPVLVPKRN